MGVLDGKTIVFGVTGGIAAYKSCEAVSRLKKLGATVCVIMTKNATEFVAPMTFETLSNQPCVVDTFARPERWEVEHVSLAKRADLFVIALRPISWPSWLTALPMICCPPPAWPPARPC